MNTGGSDDFDAVAASPTDAYEEGLAFFRGEGMINNTIRRLADDLDRTGIDYAVIGALALNLHGYRRFTHDIDVLMTPRGLEAFHSSLAGTGYFAAYPGSRKQFRTAEGRIPVDIVTAGEYPGDGLPRRVAFPDPAGNTVVIDGVKALTLEKLVELKLASGLTAPDRRKDLADVQELAKAKGLDEGFAARLDESVRGEYLKICGEIRQAQALRQRLGRTL